MVARSRVYLLRENPLGPGRQHTRLDFMAGRLGPGVGVRIGWVAAEGADVTLSILDTKPHVCIARHTHTQGAGFASGGVRGAAGREHYHSTAGLERRRLSGRQSQRAPQHDLAAWARSALRFAAELRLAAGFHLSAPLSIHCLRYRFTSGCSAYASLTGLRLRRLTNVCGCLAPVRAPALKSVKRLLAMGHSNGSGAPTAIYLSI